MKRYQNRCKKIAAGAMAAVMTAGVAGGTAMRQPVTRVDAADEDVETLKNAAEKVLGDTDAAETDGVYKDETVYVKADSSGKTTSVKVSEWLKNPEKGEVEDQTELEDIKNVKGDETYTASGENEISWKSEGNDIYYQGSTDKELPVDVKISYKLDGKDISAEELKGKSGKVEIHIDYENRSKKTVEVGGEETEMYTPFTMVTGLLLPTDEYKNVTIDSGKIISDADKDIVVGLGFPGLSENLDLEDLDLDIPESVTITADVKDASVGPTITMVSSEILDQFDLSEVNDFDSLDDAVSQLENASEQLLDGANQAADGAKALDQGAGALADGSKTLADGSKALADGISQMQQKSAGMIDGMNELAAGVLQYTGSVSSLSEGSAEVAKGAGQVDQGAAQMESGINTVKSGADQLAQGIQDADGKVSQTVSEVANGLSGIAGALSGAQGALGNITATARIENAEEIAASAAQAAVKAAQESGVSDPAALEQIRQAVAGELTTELQNAQVQAQVQGSEVLQQAIAGAQAGVSQMQETVNGKVPELTEGMNALKNGAAQLQAGLGTGTSQQKGLSEAAKELKAGTKDLSDGANALAAGAEQLNEAGSLLNIGSGQLKDGGSQLKDGVGQLSSGAGSVASGALALQNGSRTLADGTTELAQGNRTLADGVSEFKADGIDKLTEVFGGDIKKVTERIDAMGELGRQYQSFAGLKDGMDGSTKFMIETEAVN